jgi:hypothetical protein
MKTFKNLREQIDSVAEGKRGLWDNIHAKRKRIKAGSGERMRKPGSEGAPTAAALKASQTEEVQIDESWIVHDSNGKLIKKFSTHKAAKAHAEKTGHEFASAEFYHDKIQKNVKEEVEEIFDLIEDVIEDIAKENNVDSELIWEDLESVSDEELLEVAAWQRKEGKNPSGGLNAKGVASYRRENPGSKLQTAVTTKPSKLKAGSKAANRRKSFCARMGGMKKRLTSAETARDPDSRINKALRKWNC